LRCHLTLTKPACHVRGFTFDGLSNVLTRVAELDKRQRLAVMAAVEDWLRPKRCVHDLLCAVCAQLDAATMAEAT
jgi:hypothetical protein